MLYIYYIYAKLQWSWLKIEDEMFRTNEGLFDSIIHKEPLFK